MIKSCVKDFNNSTYREIDDFTTLVEGDKVKLTGSIFVTKRTGKQKEFISLTISKKNGLVGATIFPESALYDSLEKFSGAKFEGSLYGSIYMNGKYVNINIDNADYWVDDVPSASELNIETSQRYVDLRSYVDEIDDAYLKAVVFDIYNNSKIMNKFLSAPASEFSAYSYLGGLAKMTEDTCFVVTSMAQNNDLNNLLGLNHDMLLTAALLCNIGRAYMYDIDKDGKFSKNEYGIIDSDTSLTRDAVKQAMRNVAAMSENSDVVIKPKNADVVKELIHVDTSKSSIGFQPATAPRTRTASLFASIINMVNTAGTFDKLEKSNVANDKLVKAFEGGKYYYIPQE